MNNNINKQINFNIAGVINNTREVNYNTRGCEENNEGSILNNCPKPVIYKPLVTGDNNPQMFPGNRYSQYVRSALGRPGYQKPRYGDRKLSPFGYWQGAPSGYGKPPQNSFV